MLAITKCRMQRGTEQDPGDYTGRRARIFCIIRSAILALAFVLCGCTPPGPRALLKGQRLIGRGKYEQAVPVLQEATRLLPKTAQAYNHLGLALHGSKQFAPALAAYKKALALDHKLAAAHYNLGCLYLEQNDPASATEELTSYTLLQSSSVDGWIKLGNAQLRAHRVDAAEKAFKSALTLQPHHSEVLNGLGIIQLQRKRPQDALNYFNLALGQNTNYGPALLNAAVVNQQNLNNSLALEKYRQYLAVQPRPANWEAVSALASRLDLELNPRPVHVAQVTSAPPPAIKSNFVPALTNLAARPASNRPPSNIAALNPRTNLPAASAVPAKGLGQTNQGQTNPFVIAARPPPVETPKLPPVVNKPTEIEVTQVPDELVVKPPQEIAVVRPPALPLANEGERTIANPTNPAPLLVNPDSKPDKRGLFSRLNPFGGKPKPAGVRDGAPGSSESSVTGSVLLVAATPTNLVLTTPAAAPPSFPRYTYLSPPKPVAGDRRTAERFFAEGIKAQQAGRPALALAAYQKATQTDPAYFEAYYNEGLAAYGIANWKESLMDYEYALAVKPGSVDARYNFALALQQANYPRDAGDELLEILNENPGEVRAHLLLANLYARQLNQPKLARQHYLKVLETEPRHPKAPEIRYWLAANP